MTAIGRSFCGAVSAAACLFPLDRVIAALLTSRILVQFVGQIAGVILLRRRRPEMPRPYRIWLYPATTIVALAGWLFIFATTGVAVMLFGIGVLALGSAAFLLWSYRLRQWPFAT